MIELFFEVVPGRPRIHVPIQVFIYRVHLLLLGMGNDTQGHNISPPIRTSTSLLAQPFQLTMGPLICEGLYPDGDRNKDEDCVCSCLLDLCKSVFVKCLVAVFGGSIPHNPSWLRRALQI